MRIPESVRNEVFRRIVRRALGEGPRFSPHGLRHTWASLQIARGTPLQWTQEQGGWTTAKVLLDTCGHLMPTGSRRFADALAAIPDGHPTPPMRPVETSNSDSCSRPSSPGMVRFVNSSKSGTVRAVSP